MRAEAPRKEKSLGASGKPSETSRRFCLEHKRGRRYIVDSGASFHLVSKNNLNSKERHTIVSLDRPIPIQTANGEVELNEKVRICVHDLNVYVWAHLLPNTVAVLSLGLLIDDLGFSYHWTPKKKPYLEKGKVKVTCHPPNNVPFIYPSASSDDRDKWENAGEQEEEGDIKDEPKSSPPLAPREGELDGDDVPTIRSRP